jgi:hypothetical protein
MQIDTNIKMKKRDNTLIVNLIIDSWPKKVAYQEIEGACPGTQQRDSI